MDGPEVFPQAVDGRKAIEGLGAAVGASLSGFGEVGPQTTDEGFPQIRAEATVFRDPVLYLCSRSSRRCGYVENGRFRSSALNFCAQGHVHNLGISEGDLWMKKSCPQGFHSAGRVLHSLSPS